MADYIAPSDEYLTQSRVMEPKGIRREGENEGERETGERAAACSLLLSLSVPRPGKAAEEEAGPIGPVGGSGGGPKQGRWRREQGSAAANLGRGDGDSSRGRQWEQQGPAVGATGATTAGPERGDGGGPLLLCPLFFLSLWESQAKTAVRGGAVMEAPTAGNEVEKARSDRIQECIVLGVITSSNFSNKKKSVPIGLLRKLDVLLSFQRKKNVGGHLAVALTYVRSSVGTSTAAFALALLEGSSQPGVWFPEEEEGISIEARQVILQRASEGTINFIMNKPPWMVETDSKELALGIYM
ncbi:hypothetical protein Taro_026065 [Colocasia esculenta]|uniref:Uncharacterized protein n=1 Tax=Colocasia esculenta TaxID=4460 RepID=A0A843VMF8_COLES|nr:hypothetical protein [Colocasia esculenta]